MDKKLRVAALIFVFVVGASPSLSEQHIEDVPACDILEAQISLAALGHDPGPADGLWGPSTKNAVRNFQQANGLAHSGVLDELTCWAVSEAQNKKLGKPRGLAKSVSDGEPRRVAIHIALGADPNSDNGGTPSLVEAAANNRQEILRMLLESGAFPDAVTTSGETATAIAAAKGHFEVVSTLLAAGANPEGRGDSAPLVAAVSNGHRAIARRLLASGANPNAVTPTGETAVMLAAQKGYAEILSDLLAKGGDPDPKTELSSPILRAVEAGHLAVFRQLADAGVNISPSISEIALSLGHNSILDEITERQSRIAAEREAQILKAAAKQRDLLMQAVHFGRTIDIKELLNDRNSVDLADDVGVTPLMLAAQKGDQLHVELLLKNGANVNHRSDLSLGHYVNARDLSAGGRVVELAPGLNMTARLDLGSLIFDGQSSRDIERIAFGTNAVFEATRSRRAGVAEYLIGHGADANLSNGLGETPLMHAAYFGPTDVVRALLSGGADPNTIARISDLDGWKMSEPLMRKLRRQLLPPALIGAARAGRYEVVELLLNSGADIEIKAEDGPATALVEAALRGQGDVVALLLERGADVNAQTSTGATAIHAAALTEKSDAQLIGALIAAGADPTLPGPNGLTPLQLAAMSGASEVVSFLIESGVPLQANSESNSPLELAAFNDNIGALHQIIKAGSQVPETFVLNDNISKGVSGLIEAARTYNPLSEEFRDTARNLLKAECENAPFRKRIWTCTDAIRSGLFGEKDLVKLHERRLSTLRSNRTTGLRIFDDLDALVELAPNNPDFLLKRGRHYFNEKKMSEFAFSDFRRALDLSPTPSDVRGSISYNLGRALRLSGNAAEALENLKEASTLDPSNPTYVLELARAYRDLEDLHTAKVTALSAVELLRNQPSSAKSVRQTVLALNIAGQTDDAQPLYQELLTKIEAEMKKGQSYWWDWKRRGRYQAALGQHEMAIQSFDRVIAENPRHGEAFYLRGLSLEAIGEEAAALEDYRTSLRRQAGYKPAQDRLADLVRD